MHASAPHAVRVTLLSSPTRPRCGQVPRALLTLSKTTKLQRFQTHLPRRHWLQQQANELMALLQLPSLAESVLCTLGDSQAPDETGGASVGEPLLSPFLSAVRDFAV